jgi:hypothetical protein
MLADNLSYEGVSWFAAEKHGQMPNIDSMGADRLSATLRVMSGTQMEWVSVTVME